MTTMNTPPIEFGLLANVPLLEGLTPEDFNQLVAFTEIKQYGSGDTLFLKGDPGGALIVVMEGEVELFIYDDSNRRVILSLVDSGGFFGEITLFDSSPRTTNALATKPTKIIMLRREVMVDFVHKYPDAGIHIINVLSRRLRDTTELVTNKSGNAFSILEESSNFWDRLADRVSAVVGSWLYLATLIGLIVLWVIYSLITDSKNGIPSPLDGMGIIITTIGALQLPLILMSQNRQDKFEKIQADLDHDVNVKAQLSILEVNRKLDWLQEAMLLQAERLEKIENDHTEVDDHDDRAERGNPEADNGTAPHIHHPGHSM